MPRPSPLGITGTSLSWREPKDGRLTVCQVRAKDKNGAWQCKRFPVTSWRRDGSPILPEGAKQWAEDTRSDFLAERSLAGSTKFQDFSSLLVDNLKAAGISTGRIDRIKAVSAGLDRAGIRDMKSTGFPQAVRGWISGLKTGWSLPAGAPNQRTNRKPLSAASRNVILTMCRQVTGLAVLKRKLAFDPLQELGNFKGEKRLRPLFSISELRHMVSDAARDKAITARAEVEAEINAKVAAEGIGRIEAIQAISKARNVHWTTIYNILRRPAEPDPWWLACCLLVYTGCRASEGMAIRWEWIDWDTKRIELKLTGDYESKSDAEREIPLEPELEAILQPLKKTAGHILPPQIRVGGSGMRTHKGASKGKGARDYAAAMNRYLVRIGLDPKDRTPHSLRHCYITLKLAREDTNTERLRKAVGHAQFNTTKGYGELSQRYEQEVDTWPDRTMWLRRNVS